MKSIRLEQNGGRSQLNYRLYVVAVCIGCLFIAGGYILGKALTPPRAPQFAGDSGGIERYVTHISTDKPIYRTGEKVYVRGVILHSDGHTPMTNVQVSRLAPSFEIKGPKGETVASGVSTVVDSVI